jgi:hypothetical protein
MQDGATPHAQLRELSVHYAVFGEFNEEDRIINKGLWPLDPQI